MNTNAAVRRQLRTILSNSILGVQITKKDAYDRSSFIAQLSLDESVVSSLHDMITALNEACPREHNSYGKDPALGDIWYVAHHFDEVDEAKRAAFQGFLTSVISSRAFQKQRSAQTNKVNLYSRFKIKVDPATFKERKPIRGGQDYQSQPTPSATMTRHERQKAGSALIPSNLSNEQGKGFLENTAHPDAFMSNDSLPKEISIRDMMTDISNAEPTADMKYSTKIRGHRAETDMAIMKRQPTQKTPSYRAKGTYLPPVPLYSTSTEDRKSRDQAMTEAAQSQMSTGRGNVTAEGQAQINITTYPTVGMGTGGKTQMGGPPGTNNVGSTYDRRGIVRASPESGSPSEVKVGDDVDLKHLGPIQHATARWTPSEEYRPPSRPASAPGNPFQGSNATRASFDSKEFQKLPAGTVNVGEKRKSFMITEEDEDEAQSPSFLQTGGKQPWKTVMAGIIGAAVQGGGENTLETIKRWKADIHGLTAPQNAIDWFESLLNTVVADPVTIPLSVVEDAIKAFKKDPSQLVKAYEANKDKPGTTFVSMVETMKNYEAETSMEPRGGKKKGLKLFHMRKNSDLKIWERIHNGLLAGKPGASQVPDERGGTLAPDLEPIRTQETYKEEVKTWSDDKLMQQLKHDKWQINEGRTDQEEAEFASDSLPMVLEEVSRRGYNSRFAYRTGKFTKQTDEEIQKSTSTEETATAPQQQTTEASGSNNNVIDGSSLVQVPDGPPKESSGSSSSSSSSGLSLNPSGAGAKRGSTAAESKAKRQKGGVTRTAKTREQLKDSKEIEKFDRIKGEFLLVNADYEKAQDEYRKADAKLQKLKRTQKQLSTSSGVNPDTVDSKAFDDIQKAILKARDERDVAQRQVQRMEFVVTRLTDEAVEQNTNMRARLQELSDQIDGERDANKEQELINKFWDLLDTYNILFTDNSGDNVFDTAAKNLATKNPIPPATIQTVQAAVDATSTEPLTIHPAPPKPGATGSSSSGSSSSWSAGSSSSGSTGALGGGTVVAGGAGSPSAESGRGDSPMSTGSGASTPTIPVPAPNAQPPVNPVSEAGIKAATQDSQRRGGQDDPSTRPQPGDRGYIEYEEQKSRERSTGQLNARGADRESDELKINSRIDHSYVPTLRLFFNEGDANVVSKVNDNKEAKEKNRQVWYSFDALDWEANEEYDNDLHLQNRVEEARRFHGPLDGDEMMVKKASEAVQESYNKYQKEIFYFPSKLTPDVSSLMLDVRGGAPLQPLSESETEATFHDVYMKPWIEIPESSPWKRFTQVQGTQMCDMQIRDPSTLHTNDALGDRHENMFIYTTDV